MTPWQPPRGRSRPFWPALALAIVLTLAALPGAAGARTLHWREVAVDARLDAEGRLHVRERQTMVFDGDWNGGERVFRLKGGQRLDFERLSRIEPGGEPVAMTEGDLDRVDHYDFVNRTTLRWRSRMPGDPPFTGQEITYLLEYRLSGILARRGERYELDHDFSFPDRFGIIERFVLDLELDPAWSPRQPLPGHLEREGLAPGRGVVLTAELDYTGPGRPGAAAPGPTPLALRLATFLAALAVMGWLLLRWRGHEGARARFERPRLPAHLDPDWLAEHLFAFTPEEAGTLWDRQVGAPEVAAVLARLVAEGKLASELRESTSKRGKEVLVLRLLVPREAFAGHARKLIDKLFFARRTETDTEAVKEHYKKTGFNPASTIRGGIDKALRKKIGPRPGIEPSRLEWQLFGLWLLALGGEAVLRGSGVLKVLGACFVGLPFPLSIGLLLALWYRRTVHNQAVAALLLPLPVLALTFLCFLAANAALVDAQSGVYPGPFGVLALALWPVAVLALLLRIARTRESAEQVRLRARMGAIRQRFAIELRRARPALDDDWFPYLLAFGLHQAADRWSVEHGGGLRTPSLPSSIGASSGSGGPSWSGGGGAFGGAGAVAGWGAAAAGLAAGVASPSSGGSSGGGSSGGGSSGGGGGGGW